LQNKKLRDDQKIRHYERKRRLTKALKKPIKLSIDKQSEIDDNKFLIASFFPNKKEALKILKELSSKGITYNLDNLELIFNDEPVRNTNIYALVNHLSSTTKKAIKQWNIYKEVLTQANINPLVIRNAHRRQELQK
jgi:hypothetical protein